MLKMSVKDWILIIKEFKRLNFDIKRLDIQSFLLDGESFRLEFLYIFINKIV